MYICLSLLRCFLKKVISYFNNIYKHHHTSCNDLFPFQALKKNNLNCNKQYIYVRVSFSSTSRLLRHQQSKPPPMECNIKDKYAY